MKKIVFILALMPLSLIYGCNQNGPLTVDLGDFNLHTEAQEKYLQSGDHSKIDASGEAHLDKPNPVTFTVKDVGVESKYKTYYSYNYTYDDKEIENEHYAYSDNNKISLTNLELGKKYYFKVVNKNRVIEQGTFNTNPGIIRNLDVDGMKNVRDMGGYQTGLGYFKPNMIYRTSELNNSVMDGENDSYVTLDGARTLINDFKIKTEIDLRMVDEEIPTPFIDTSILKYTYKANVNLVQLDIDYNGFNILSTKERKKIRQFFNELSDINNYPVCFHCHIGTDRTGMFGAALHALLGGDADHIYYDYMFSNFAYIGGARTEDGINNSFFNYVNDYHGSTLADKTYNLLTEQVEIPAAQLDAIRDILLD